MHQATNALDRLKMHRKCLLAEVVTPAVSDADRTIAAEVLIACGVIPELAARLVTAVKVEPLDEETLARIVAGVDIGRAFGQGP
jgi:ATP-dependent protease Clp ATPase subunit